MGAARDVEAFSLLLVAVRCGANLYTDSHTSTHWKRLYNFPLHNSKEREEKTEKPEVRHIHTWGKLLKKHSDIITTSCFCPVAMIPALICIPRSHWRMMSQEGLVAAVYCRRHCCCCSAATTEPVFLRMFSPNMAADLPPPGLHSSSTAPPGRHDITPTAFPIINN